MWHTVPYDGTAMVDGPGCVHAAPCGVFEFLRRRHEFGDDGSIGDHGSGSTAD
jgi:hypothetical protein